MSKIQVDAIEQQTACGTTLTAGGGAGKTVVVDATTVTLGRCGGTVALASGASQTGFGRTGTVDWQTTPKTATFTAVSGEGYFANTTGSAFNINLPAGVAGAIVSVADYAATFQTNNLTIVPNGTDKIGSINADVFLNTEGQSVTLVFVDSTQGWINTMDSTSNVRGSPFLVASGGTESTSGNCKIHIFTGPGTFTVSAASTTAAENIVSYMVVGGGGAGASGNAGTAGGGAGGFREIKSPLTPYTASPLDGYPSAPNRVTVTAQAYPITVGGGGAVTGPAAGSGNPGNNSTFSTITSASGGGGGKYGGGGHSGTVPAPVINDTRGGNGGSGGGGGATCSSTAPVTALIDNGGLGNTPSVSPAQGFVGGKGRNGYYYSAGGGGGAGVQGTDAGGPNADAGNSYGGAGGNGVTTSITASSVTRAGGGGGVGWTGNAAGGSGGGGGGGRTSGPTAGNGTANTGGGGGGGGGTIPTGGGLSGGGGSGIVVIRYKFQ